METGAMKTRCALCANSRQHARAHGTYDTMKYQYQHVKCAPHRILQPALQYISQFLRDVQSPGDPLDVDEAWQGFEQNPNTLAGKCDQLARIEFAPPPSQEWGEILAYQSFSIAESAWRLSDWKFSVVLYSPLAEGEYYERRMGIVFQSPAGDWGLLPDPVWAIAAAFALGWQFNSAIDTCCLARPRRLLEPAEIPLYQQRISCEECEDKTLFKYPK